MRWPEESPPDESQPDESPPDESPPDESPPDESPPDESPPGAASRTEPPAADFLVVNYLVVASLAAQDHPAACLDPRVRQEAFELLRRRFPSCSGLLTKLMSGSPHGTIQCHCAKRPVPVPPHRLLVLREGGRVVAATILQHVPAPRRQAEDQAFSEVLLFAVSIVHMCTCMCMWPSRRFSSSR